MQAHKLRACWRMIIAREAANRARCEVKGRRSHHTHLLGCHQPAPSIATLRATNEARATPHPHAPSFTCVRCARRYSHVLRLRPDTLLGAGLDLSAYGFAFGRPAGGPAGTMPLARTPAG